jgi:hypothetical protein
LYWDYLFAGEEVSVELTIADPKFFDGYGTDLDVTIYDSMGNIMFVGWEAYNAWEDPHLAEYFGFVIPEDGLYYLEVYGWNVQPEGVEYTLIVEWGDLPDPTTAPPCGVSRGSLVAFSHSAWNGKMHATPKSALNRWMASYSHAMINDWTILYPDEGYRAPSGVFCTEDHLAVGGLYFVRYIPPFTPEVARDLVENTEYYRFLRRVGSDTWIPLSSLTEVYSGPVKPDHDHGILFRYSKLLQVGFFKPGELAEKLGGPGHFEYNTTICQYGETVYTQAGTFWLLPPP